MVIFVGVWIGSFGVSFECVGIVWSYLWVYARYEWVCYLCVYGCEFFLVDYYM